MAELIPSPEQQAIYREFEFGTTHFLVDAYAGTGKTTTAVNGLLRAPERNILVTCFNKKIEVAGNAKLKSMGVTNAKYQTLHSLGFGFVMRNWEGVSLCENFERQSNLTQAVCGGAVPDAIKRLVSKLHTLGREILPYATRGDELLDLAEQFECAPDEQWEESGYDVNFVCTKAVAAMDLAARVKPADRLIDYTDLIFLPLRNKWLVKRFDMVIVDETQDLTLAKLDLAQGVCKGRVVIIGDRNQAIYAFLGADCNSMDRLQEQLNAKSLKLSVTFRCGKAIVAEAQRFVPDYTAHDSNPEGEVLNIPFGKLAESAGPGDFVLSRLNAPLVSIAMRLLRMGKRTEIAGRQIGKGLVALVRKLKGRSVPDLLKKINSWKERESARLQSRYAGKLDSPAYTTRLEAIADQAMMLSEIAESCKSTDEVTQKIEALFAKNDDNTGKDAGVITCSSVHRSKGLEAKRVFVLSDTLRDYNQEEKNIQYVAVTRAINTLVYVKGLS